MTASGGGARVGPRVEAGEPCEQCGSPLAADQRYCLNCGRRRGGPRVDYRERISPAAAGDREAPAPPSANGTEPPPERGQRDYAPLAAVGGIAVLGLMLLVGVLIGRGDGGTTTPPPPVVVQGGGAARASESDTAAGGAAGGGGSGQGAGAGGKQKAGKKGKAGNETAASEGAVTASDDDLAELEGETGEAGAKNALKLPNKIATPGGPPPIDKSKPPGGGEGGGMVIK